MTDDEYRHPDPFVERAMRSVIRVLKAADELAAETGLTREEVIKKTSIHHLSDDPDED